MKTNLAQILWKKEKIHWNRTFGVFAKFNNWFGKLTFGIIIALIGTIAHYCFAIMHTLFEMFLWVFFRRAFKANLQKLALKV
jgi:hypothetical protein